MTGRVFFKLLGAFVLVLLIGTAMLDISLRRIVDGALRKQVEQSLVSEARVLGAQLQAGGPVPALSLVRVAAEASRAQVTVFSAEGRVQAASAAGPLTSDTESAPELAMVRTGRQQVGKAIRRGALFVAVPAGAAVVRMEYPLTEVNAKLHQLRRDILLASLVSLLLGTTMAAWFAHRVAQRLRRIVTFAEQIAAGDLSARVREEDLDEISAVARALDTTASRLEETFHSLESSRRELTALLDSMQEGVVAVTASGLVSWSNAVISRLAQQPVRVGRPLVQTIRDPEVLDCLEAALREGKIRTGRGKSVVPGRTFEVNAAPMPGGGAVVVLHDVTGIEQAETTRRDFVANVSHELRTPLTSISGYVETILDGREPLGADTREFLEIIQKNATRMNRLTEDLLALARVEAGDYKLDLRPIPASALVEDAMKFLTPVIAEAGMTLEYAAMVPDRVMADPDALQQVFGNLLENASKYGRAGGRVQMGAKSADGQVEFFVRDFGPGIASEHQPRIFERFYRVDKARSRESGGTGLGLSIARRIVHAHGGSIRVESELGAGTTFLFALPATDREDPDETWGSPAREPVAVHPVRRGSLRE